MKEREKALIELEEIKKRTIELERIIKGPVGFEVTTPVDYEGDILFNDNKQSLGVYNGLYNVVALHEPGDDERDSFLWIPCERGDLVAGNTAYRDIDKNLLLNNTTLVCKILSNKQYVYITEEKEAFIGTLNFHCWYKLVKKEDL